MTSPGGHVDGVLHPEIDESTNLLPASVTDEIVTHCLGGEPNTGCPPMIPAVFDFSPTKSSNLEAMTSPGGHVDGVLHPEIEETVNLLSASATSQVITSCFGVEPNSGFPPLISELIYCSLTDPGKIGNVTSAGHTSPVNRECVHVSAYHLTFTETGREIDLSLCGSVYLLWADNISVTKIVLRRYKVRLKIYIYELMMTRKTET
jgi:hypothetical protein